MYFLYLSKPSDKEYDFDILLNYSSLSLHEEQAWEVDEIYADGWVNIPNGIEDLVVDAKTHAKKLKGIALYSLEEINDKTIKILSNIAPIYCVLCPWIQPSKTSEELIAVKNAKEYYSQLTSLRIRQGVKASSKSSGAAPFGYRHDDDGKLVPNHQLRSYETLLQIVKLDHAGVSVSEIGKKVQMSPAKIYGILKTAKGRDA